MHVAFISQLDNDRLQRGSIQLHGVFMRARMDTRYYGNEIYYDILILTGVFDYLLLTKCNTCHSRSTRKSVVLLRAACLSLMQGCP